MNAMIVGAGAAGLLHALALRAHRVRIEGVLDPVREKARALAEMLDARVLGTIDEVASSDARIVAITSPPRAHVGQALRCASDGRLVLVEKPVAMNEGELDVLATAPGIVPIVQWRAGRALRSVREAVRRDVFGEALSVAVDLAWSRDDAYRRARASWRCPPILSIGIHALDALVFSLGGPPEESHAMELGGATALIVRWRRAVATVRFTIDAAADRTRFDFAGAHVTATFEGTENDPTAGEARWEGRPSFVARDGVLGSPLLVPYIGRALAAWQEGHVPGSSDALPSIADVRAGHALAFAVSGEVSCD
jgi:predicted dehydrogenase